MDDVCVLFMNEVLRTLPVSSYEALASLNGTFGKVAKQWKERWFVSYYLLYVSPDKSKIECALVKEQNLPKFLPNSYADLTECDVKQFSHLYEKEFTVSLHESKTYEDLDKLNWNPVTPEEIKKFLRSVKCDMKCLAVSVIPPWERNDLPIYNPDYLLNIIPRSIVFNDITIDDNVSSPLIDEKLQMSVESQKLRHVTYEKFIEEAPVENLIQIALSDNVECVEVTQKCRTKPFLKLLTDVWLQQPHKFTRPKTICGLCKLMDYHVFEEKFTKFDRLPEEAILDETVSSEYEEDAQVFYEMRHPVAVNRRIVIGFFGGEQWDQMTFKDCTEDNSCLSYCLFMID
ncbi:hypothetical protein QR680_019324 [Steinernema hermaphroditum]|uniref:F-box domain-containing protein n=1 Tax=Steinernema hermaphroditum TaxID=289476 RepID=A0AA39LAY3_9BILA|nr:hypothetical protein QR680_019324 [Steinernema hermaphroditum]